MKAHLASALKIPTITLFGPTNQVKNAPWKSKIIQKMACDYQPCYGPGWERSNCEYPVNCMKAIKPKDVLEVIDAMV